ncbi:putative UPF0481 protein At3g02645 [Cynara cardunculus var. scolymus]|uniref:putative UPF0481 protein At3g02645 n=1 Tax=Cynara cardunculus var. scolymus TaxID=59895 RepID=UPI000D62ADD1|nr:putative UPF0481 protein At3g02645 [Cynara cardunculus var. scolymus]
MASLNPLSGPNSGDKSWVDHISKTLKSQIAVTIDTPPVSIFEIPKTLKAEKLEAYTPQRIGLGPNHHFQSELYQKMEQNKLTAVKRILRPHQIQDHQDQVVEKVREIIPIICACYDLYLDADDDTLAWLFAIDGLFLLDHLRAYSDHQFGIEAKDLIMLENQIPLIVLKEIQKAISISDEKADAQEDYLESKLHFFCKSHSPFLLSKEKVDFSRVNHILDYMYHSIVNNETSISRQVNFTNHGSGSPEKDAKQELLEALVKMGGLIPGAKPFLEIIESIRKDFSDSIEKKQMVEEIKVPSVSELGDIAGVKFRLSPGNEGIRNISFVVEKERSCYLPLITLNMDSEVILRNLVAYEQLMAKNSFAAGYGLELTEYVDFMCGIIDTAKDVRLLRKEKIIEGDLGDEEIVKMFNGIGRSQGKMSVVSELRKTVAELNKVYESMPRVWVQRTAEKQVRGSAKAITFLVSISSTLILIREVYSKVYGSNPPHMMLVRFLLKQVESFSSLIQ